ncbi:hypothetical protein K435DRAFT_780387 [Dendrothele bispora CBS 962.96]|uniref:Uncharacterized protein n=1 Tax=Dendrothele bispora (strain CBS 962.96) TaxID=1314807 RepID=A0A4S8LS50_DENBC|nr:hypothetical protein K435DRAFT_780387 [Dendrothele bispora CBS 962.96]
MSFYKSDGSRDDQGEFQHTRARLDVMPETVTPLSTPGVPFRISVTDDQIDLLRTKLEPAKYLPRRTSRCRMALWSSFSGYQATCFEIEGRIRLNSSGSKTE